MRSAISSSDLEPVSATASPEVSRKFVRSAVNSADIRRLAPDRRERCRLRSAEPLSLCVPERRGFLRGRISFHQITAAARAAGRIAGEAESQVRPSSEGGEDLVAVEVVDAARCSPPGSASAMKAWTSERGPRAEGGDVVGR